MLRAKLTSRARAEIQRVDAWWRVQRANAPDLVIDEIDAALALLEQTPHVGSPYRGSRVGTRRLLLTQTRFHLYYYVRSDDLIVLSIWSALRGRGPRV
jgi:plasmid stabilization system protein ParE